MSIRNKLILMLALPLAALALVGALGFRGQSATALAASEALQDDGLVQSLNRSIKAIGAERIAVTDGVQGVDLEELELATDASLTEVRTLAAAVQLTSVETAAEAATVEVAAGRDSGSVMTQVLEMNNATEALRNVRDSVDVDYPSTESFAEATSIDYAVDIVDRQDSIWLEYIVADEITPDIARRLREEIVATELLRDQIIEIAPESHVAPLNASLASDMDAAIERAGIVAIDRFERNEGPLPDDATLEAVVDSHQDWYGHAVMLQDDIAANLELRAEEAEARQNLFALLGTLGLLVLFGLIYVVYRSVVRPLDDLLAGAEEIATNRLPAVVAELRTMGSDDANVSLKPLPRESDDELGSLVDAFNDVQLTAFDLAVEQARSRRNIAEMFVNLGRRNQKLLQRMLAVISELEQDEKDPNRLERLFDLDHMTTRMRRNAESLLVVAGTKAPRQWAKPVPAADVVRSALAEVQDYHRIDVLSLANAPMAGNAVTDVTHMLAELLENSLQFSDPGSRVTVSSRWNDNGYRIVITDQGFGMSPEELEENNRLIANPPPPDQAPTRFLGLFVVGHLAGRHGIEVVLTDATIGGTDARITIPRSVMTEARPTEGDAKPGLPVRNDEPDLDAELAKLTAETDTSREAEIVAGDMPMRSDADLDLAELASRGGEPDLDAELAKLTAETDTSREAEIVAGDKAPSATKTDTAVSEAQAPVEQANIDFGELPELPTFEPGSSKELPPPPPAPAPVADLPVRGEVAAPVADLPVRGEVAAPVADLPVRGEVAAPVADLPAPPAPAPVADLPAPPAPAPVADLPVRNDLTSPSAPSPARSESTNPTPSASTTAFTQQTAAPAADAAADFASMGLPQRTPRATLEDTGGLPAGAQTSEPVPTAPATEPEDVTETASNVGSMFSAFQAGVQRGEQSH